MSLVPQTGSGSPPDWNARCSLRIVRQCLADRWVPPTAKQTVSFGAQANTPSWSDGSCIGREHRDRLGSPSRACTGPEASSGTHGLRPGSFPGSLHSRGAKETPCLSQQPMRRRSSIRKMRPKSAGLRYVSDARPGIRRRRSGKASSTRAKMARSSPRPTCSAHQGARHPASLDRRLDLSVRGRAHTGHRPRCQRTKAVPLPCAFPRIRESTKYEHVVAFADASPGIRAKVREHMALRGLPREKVLATVVHLLETTLIRSETTITPSRTTATA